MRLSLTLTGAAEAQALLAATAARLTQPPAPLLTDLATALQRNLQTHIQNQTGPDGPWPALAPVTRKIRGYYGYPPDGPALVRGGDLLQSIATLTQEDRSIEVGTRAPFARTLQDGGTIADPRTGHTRTVQAFPFVYVTAREVEDLLTAITAYYFGDPNA
jgi:phage gpG-like protein